MTKLCSVCRMAPEVILAMDEGQYDGKVAYWKYMPVVKLLQNVTLLLAMFLIS